jgi:hypothetical protein
MTIAPETCVCECECEECLALRAAKDAPGSGETVASFKHDGSTYEIDHLGIGSGSQWGEFEVYCYGEEVAEFTLAESLLRPGSRPAGLPVSADELVRLARQALSGSTGRDDPPGGRPLGPGPEAIARHLAATGPAARRAPASPVTSTASFSRSRASGPVTRIGTGPTRHVT